MRAKDAGRSVMEGLECRRMLSAVPVPIADLAIDESLDLSGGGPTSLYAGGTVYFSAVTSRDRGQVELWKTDPATGQSAFVKSFSGGGGLNATTPVLSSFAPGPGSTAYFVLNVSSGVPQIWRTDGTDAGTFQVYGVNQSFSISTRIPFVRRGNSTYFAAGGIWRIDDATPSNASQVSGGSGGTGLTLANGNLYFLNNQYGTAGLYQINAAGTAATRIFSAVSSPTSLTQNNGALFFFGNDASSGASNLYTSDGTAAGTKAVAPVQPSSLVSSTVPITGMGSNVYFTAYTAATGAELWKSDGTAAGTSMVTDLRPGSADPRIGDQVVYNGALYFTAVAASGAGESLWKTDGTAEGTVQVSGFDGSPTSGVLETAVVGNTVYMEVRTTATGSELWRSDGTEDGTRLAFDQYPGRGAGRPHRLLDAGGTLYYEGNDPVTGNGFFRSDGTRAGTSLVKDYLPGPIDMKYNAPSAVVTPDGRVFYVDGDSTPTGRELYVMDGTGGGARLVKDIYPGLTGSSPQWLTVVGGTVYFAAQASTTQGVELWKSDGTAAGTVLVKDIKPSGTSGGPSSYPQFLTAVGDTLYFTAYDGGVNGTELWKSDGTAEGTVVVDASNPQSLTNVNGTLFFFAGAALWKLAPGDASPVYLQTFRSTTAYGTVFRAPVNVNGTLYFAADDGTHGLELWKSDGTTAGTVMVRDIRTTRDQFGDVGSKPDLLMAAGNVVVFQADDGTTGRELWASDGTAGGTILLKDIYPNLYADSTYNGSYANPQGAMDRLVYFYAGDSVTGAELWRTDGTPAGTVLVKDIRPGVGSSFPRWMGVVAGRGYFMADDGVTGTELWSTDGTEQGTIRVSDINPGPGTSNPWRVIPVGGGIVFVAGDGVNGQQWYRFEPESVKPTVVGAQFTRLGGKAAVVVDFDEDVSGSLAGADLVVTNLTTGQALDPATFTVAYDAAKNRATFTLGGGVLVDGNYRATLGATGVRDTSGNPLAGDGTLDFFVLAGDANGDRVVNFDDLLVLAKNYNLSGAGWADGDFNGDGVVNFDDLLMLAKNYNNALDAPPPAPAPAPVMAAANLPKSPKRQAPSPVRPVFSTRPVVVAPAPVKGKKAGAPKR